LKKLNYLKMLMARERREKGRSQLNRLVRPKPQMMGNVGQVAANGNGATSAGVNTMGHVAANSDRVVLVSRALLDVANVGRGTTRLKIAPSVG
jgi:hypothetical protein